MVWCGTSMQMAAGQCSSCVCRLGVVQLTSEAVMGVMSSVQPRGVLAATAEVYSCMEQHEAPATGWHRKDQALLDLLLLASKP